MPMRGAVLDDIPEFATVMMTMDGNVVVKLCLEVGDAIPQRAGFRIDHRAAASGQV
jgi:hypothetical protein